MEILCRLSLILEGKTGKEIPDSSRFEFLRKILANNFALSGAEDNISRSLNKGGIADLPLLGTLYISNMPNVPRAKFLGSDGLMFL